MGIPWDGMGQAWTAMEWDGTEKYVPWTSVDIGIERCKVSRQGPRQCLENFSLEFAAL